MPENPPPAAEGTAETLPPATFAPGAPDVEPKKSTHGRSADRTGKAGKDTARKAEKLAAKQAKLAGKAAKLAAKEEKKAAKLEKKARKKANEKTVASVVKKSIDGGKSSDAKPQKARLRFESNMDREELAAYLEAIAKGLRKGSILFRQAETSLTLSPPSRVDTDVKVSARKGSEKLRLEVEWSTHAPQELSIVSG